MFWHPIYRAQDLEPGQTRSVQLIGERFTLYRGEGGAPHLVALRCAHRGTQLSIGWVEDDCIRCRYHGWKFDGSGQCVEQPGEDVPFAADVRIRSYPVQEYLGLIFVYLGEREAPPLRRFPDFERPGLLQTLRDEVWPVNFFSRIDDEPSHVPFTHRESARRAGSWSQEKVAHGHSEETEYGIRTPRFEPGEATSYIHFHMPNINQVHSVSRFDNARLSIDRLFWRLPVDDEHMTTYALQLVGPPGEAAEAYCKRLQQDGSRDASIEWGEAILADKKRVEDMDREFSSHQTFNIEDYVTHVGQGPIPDWSTERLGQIDEPIVFTRTIWQRELRALAEGRPLKQWREPPQPLTELDGVAIGAGARDS